MISGLHATVGGEIFKKIIAHFLSPTTWIRRYS
jgi:hypothetical protein